MRILEVDTGFDSIKFIGNSLHSGSDYFVKSNCSLESVNYCLFFDSRALSGGWESSLLQMLLDHLCKDHWLAITRPLNLTIWPTLINFLDQNEINPEIIITNIGFVDFTPKKEILINDMVSQVKYGCPDDKTKIIEMEEYVLSSGASEKLFTLQYSDYYFDKLKRIVSSLPIMTLKTPLVNSSVIYERERPVSFYKQLIETNKFLDNLECQTIELGEFDADKTYDAVHWTNEGNKYIFEKIITNL